MDFLKTLLAYMAASLLVAVESTSTPEVTPVPTPAPTAAATVQAETVTEIPSLTAEPTATVSVTPVPVPTITPNTRAYHNLGQGDRGTEVKRLQERLIELGYLPAGSADGAYGGQTRMAVRRFQYYNGLTVDGVAGRATQTNLFENPDAAPYPNAETATPAPSAETPVPETAAPETAAPEESPDVEVLSVEETPAAEESTPDGETTAPATEKPETVEATEKPETVRETPAPENGPAGETAEPSPEVTELTEDIDLDALEVTPVPEITPEPKRVRYEDLAGWIVLNDSGESMQWTELQDGVPMVRSPRMQRHEDDFRVSLDDLCKSVEGWQLSDETHSVVLEAEGYTLALLNEDAGLVATIDGLEMYTEVQDFEFEEGHFIRVDFLTRALDGEWEWDEEEDTLMIRIPPAGGNTYSD